MKTLRKQTVILLILLCQWGINLQAQSILPLEQGNLPDIVEFILTQYEGQVEISPEDLEFYLSMLLENGYASDECPPPFPSIGGYSNNNILFYWTQLPVSSYTINSLDLVTGSTNQYNTSIPEISIFSSQSLNLYAFNSECPEGRRSRYNIIIVDEDMLIQVPPEASGCQCDQWSTLNTTQVLYPFNPNPNPANPNPHTGFRALWTYNCASIDSYKVDIDGTSFSSEMYFAQDFSSLPMTYYLNNLCSSEEFDENDLYPGPDGEFHLSFDGSGFFINIETPNWNAQTSTVTVSYCPCLPKRNETIGSYENSTPENTVFTLSNFQNPVKNTLSIQFHLSQASIVDIQLFDALGQQVGHSLNLQKGAGQHDIQTDISDLPAGLYTCVIRSGAQLESFKIAKAN